MKESIALHTAVCQLSAAPDITKSQSRGMGMRNTEVPSCLSWKERKHQMLLFKQRPSFMLNTTKITWFSVPRIKKKERKEKKKRRKKKPLFLWSKSKLCEMNFNQVLPISISTQHFILQIIRAWRKWQAGEREIWRQGPEFAISRSDKGVEYFGD